LLPCLLQRGSGALCGASDLITARAAAYLIGSPDRVSRFGGLAIEQPSLLRAASRSRANRSRSNQDRSRIRHRPNLAAAYAASPDRARNHLLDGGRHDGSRVVVHRTLRGTSGDDFFRDRGRLYLLALAAIAVIGVVLVSIVSLIHVWPYALGITAILVIGFVIPIIVSVAKV
jgi:hypothetical protein